MARVHVDAVSSILGFARGSLGPECERLLSTPEAQALVLSRMRAGADLQDAVLWVVHREARAHRGVADEFVGYFLAQLLESARPAISPGLRRFVDTGDLVQSVLGDLWGEIVALDFERRSQFLAFLNQRLAWKASDRARALETGRRREDRRTEQQPDELEPTAPDRGPASLAAAGDDRERLALTILRLPERDRLLVRLYLRGASVTQLMQETGLEHEAARKALQRAIRRTREMLA